MDNKGTEPIDLAALVDTTDELLMVGSARAEDAIELGEKLIKKYRASILRSGEVGIRQKGFEPSTLHATALAKGSKGTLRARLVLGLLNGEPAYRFFVIRPDRRRSERVTPAELESEMPSPKAFGEWLDLIEAIIDLAARGT